MSKFFGTTQVCLYDGFIVEEVTSYKESSGRHMVRLSLRSTQESDGTGKFELVVPSDLAFDIAARLGGFLDGLKDD